MEGLGRRPDRLAFLTGILDDNAHAVAAIIIRQVAHDPYAGMVHRHHRRNALRRSQPKHGNVSRIRHPIAVERDDLERMSRQRKAANLGRAPIQNVEEHALALLHPNRLTVAEHPSVDGEITIPDLISVRHAFGERCFHRGLAGGFEFSYLGRRQKILVHVAALTERRLEFFEHEKDFAIVSAGLVPGFDVNRTDLPAVLPREKIGARAIVRVIETKPGGAGSEGDAPHAMRRDERRPLLCRTIDIGRNHLPMPVQLLGRVGVVVDFDRRWLAFLEAQQGAGKMSVVSDRRDDALGSNFHRTCGYVQNVICGGQVRLPRVSWKSERNKGSAGSQRSIRS